MTYEYVLAFGDSTTAGSELSPGDYNETRKLSFANQLADKLNIPCINYAWPGGSNDRSLRLLPDALLTYSNSLVLFTYTSFDRTEFFTLDNNLPQVQSEGYAPLGINWHGVSSSKRHQQLNDLYYREFFTSQDKHNRYKLYNTLLSVELLCKQYAKHFLQIFLYNGLFLPPDFQESVYNAIDKKHIYQFNGASDLGWESNNQGFGSLTQWAAVKKFQFCPGGHIGQEAHDKFAIELYNTL